MSINIVKQYINLTEKMIQEYMKLVLGNRYVKKYCDLFTERYINIRYYNFYDEDLGITMRKKILNHLKLIEEEISINNINDRELVEHMRVFYYYILYFDDVIVYKNFKDIIKK